MNMTVAPDPFAGMSAKERHKLERNFDDVVDKIVTNIIVRKSPKHLLREVYMAGLYHATLSANGWKEPDND